MQAIIKVKLNKFDNYFYTGEMALVFFSKSFKK